MSRAAPRRGQFPDPEQSRLGDRNGEPSEEDWRWEFPVGLALGAIVVLVLLVVLLIAVVAHTFPVERQYSDEVCTNEPLAG